MNVGKTKGIFLGKWKSRSDHPFGISWVKSTKLLGSKVGNFLTEDDIWGTTYTKFQRCLHKFKHRTLSLKGKSYVLNLLASSKLWYIGSFTLMPKHYLTQFQRAIFRFFWMSKSEHLNRNTMYLPYKNGGQNIVNIQRKLQAFTLKHMQALVKGSKAKWTYFAIYWVGLYLRHHNPAFASLRIPHSEFIPPFYRGCLATFNTFVSKEKKYTIGTLSVKQFYSCISSFVVHFPPVVSKHPHINYAYIWQELQNKQIDPFTRDVSWKIAHEIIPVQQVLYHRKITRYLICHLCPGLESIEHLFHTCPLV